MGCHSSQKVGHHPLFGWQFGTHFNTVWPFWKELYLNPGRTHAHMENMQAPDREAPGWKSNQWPPNCEWCNAAFLDRVNVNARVHLAAATEIFSHHQMAITVEPPKPEPATLRLSGSGICSKGSGVRISDSGFVFSGNISVRCLASVMLNCDFKFPANIVSAAFVEQILLENTSRRTRFNRDSAIHILRLRRSSREKTPKKNRNSVSGWKRAL